MSIPETNKILHGDCLEIMRRWPDASVDLVFGSPPYEDARTYGIDFNLKGQEWVDWMVVVVKESLRVCSGLVAFVVEGRTRKFKYSATPILLMADLHRAGVCLRKPPIYKRDGISGSGGPDWLKNRYEFIVCATNGGKLPWSDNTAMGQPCKYPVGGEMSYRNADGVRKNQRHRKQNGSRREQLYKHPDIANPGNIIDCGPGGGGHMGSKLASVNEAPFPESLVELFIRSFCPQDGIVFDPFSGSGTTAAVAKRCGRNFIATDIRGPECGDEDQVALSRKRLAEVQLEMF